MLTKYRLPHSTASVRVGVTEPCAGQTGSSIADHGAEFHEEGAAAQPLVIGLSGSGGSLDAVIVLDRIRGFGRCSRHLRRFRCAPFEPHSRVVKSSAAAVAATLHIVSAASLQHPCLRPGGRRPKAGRSRRASPAYRQHDPAPGLRARPYILRVTAQLWIRKCCKRDPFQIK